MSEHSTIPGLVEKLRAPIAAQIPQAKTDLAALVALPSVHGAEPDACAEAAAMVAWLAGPEAGFVTGAMHTIDGGFAA